MVRMPLDLIYGRNDAGAFQVDEVADEEVRDSNGFD